MADVETATEENGPDDAMPSEDQAKAAEEALLAASGGASSSEGRNVDALLNVKLDVRVVLGHNRMSVSDLLNLTRGSVIELDRKVGDPVDIMINDRLVARGDLVKIEGDMIGVALREIVKDFAPAD